jgi:hypothetical protein
LALPRLRRNEGLAGSPHKTKEPTWRGCGEEFDYTLRLVPRKTSRPLEVLERELRDTSFFTFETAVKSWDLGCEAPAIAELHGRTIVTRKEEPLFRQCQYVRPRKEFNVVTPGAQECVAEGFAVMRGKKQFRPVAVKAFRGALQCLDFCSLNIHLDAGRRRQISRHLESVTECTVVSPPTCKRLMRESPLAENRISPARPAVAF